MAGKHGEPGDIAVYLDRGRIEVIEETGVSAWKITRRRRASRQYGRLWAIQFDDAARLMALTPTSPSAALVLWAAMGQLQSVAWTRIVQSELAERLAIDASAVSRGLRELRERHVLIEHPSRRGHWRLGLWLAWRGTAADYQAQRRQRGDEIERARAWHEERAIANIDAEGAPWTEFLGYWRWSDDPTAHAVHGHTVARADREARR